jgi:hypothetical protein
MMMSLFDNTFSFFISLIKTKILTFSTLFQKRKFKIYGGAHVGLLILFSVFASRHILDRIRAIIFPVLMLVIPESEVRKFKLFASLTLDFIDLDGQE